MAVWGDDRSIHNSIIEVFGGIAAYYENFRVERVYRSSRKISSLNARSRLRTVPINGSISEIV